MMFTKSENMFCVLTITTNIFATVLRMYVLLVFNFDEQFVIVSAALAR